MISVFEAREFAEICIHSWNSHEIDKILEEHATEISSLEKMKTFTEHCH